ncbi:MAG: hypothetical protein FWG45_01025 [Oscillospiraceae bacterium]|nr:hypothetical protein [Oscillospiraceae bacterium]
MKIEELDQSQYREQDVTVTWRTAFQSGFASVLPPVAVCGVLNLILRGLPKWDLQIMAERFYLVIFLSLLCLGLVVAVTMLGFVLSCGNNYGVIKKAVSHKYQGQIFYCNALVKVKRYRLIAILPFIISGILPLVLALIVGDIILITSTSFLVLCLSPNVYVFTRFAEFPPDALIADSKTHIGGTVYTSIVKESGSA